MRGTLAKGHGPNLAALDGSDLVVLERGQASAQVESLNRHRLP